MAMGFQPKKGSTTGVDYYKVDASAGDIDKYDAVEFKSDGNIERLSSADDTSAVVGVALKSHSSGTAEENFPVARATENVIFLCQPSGTDIDAETDYGLNYDVSLGSAGGDDNSGMSLDSTSGVSTAATPLKLIRRHAEPNAARDDGTTSMKLEVIFNQNYYNSASAGV